MSEISHKNLLLEEYKNAYEHIRYVEAKRDKYVPGAIVASGAVLTLIVKIFSDNDFKLDDPNKIWFILVLFLLFMALGLLAYILRRVYESLSPVIQHYEDVIAVVRSCIYEDKEKDLVKINCKEKLLISWMNTRENDEIKNRDTKISDLSKNVLLILYIFWFTLAFIAAIRLIMMLFC